MSRDGVRVLEGDQSRRLTPLHVNNDVELALFPLTAKNVPHVVSVGTVRQGHSTLKADS